MADSTNTIDIFDAYRYEDGGLIPYFHKDRNGKVISQEVEGGEFSIYNNMIVLQDIPDMRYGLTVTHGGVELQQSKKPSRALEQNEYRVDSSTGFVFFHPSLEGEVVEVSNYYGRGFWLVPDNRVLTSIIRKPDGSYDYESLKDLMDGIKGYYYLEEFDPQRQYIKNNQVTYHGTTYIAVCEEPEVGAAPPERPDMWRIFAGGYGVLQDYSNSSPYVTRDLVRYEYAIYLCIKNSDGGIAPTDTQHWMRLLSIKEMVDWWEDTKGQVEDALEKVDSFDAALNKKQNEWIVTTEGTGAAYTAMLDPAPSALYTGMKITVIPHTVSMSTSATLNVNGLGAKYFRQRGYTTGSLYSPYNSSFLTSGKPVTLIYDGTYWVMTEYSKPYWYDVQSKPSSFTPSSHASTSTTYGAASNTNYGHTRISNSGSTTMSSTSTTDSGARAEAYKTVYNTSCDLNNYITEGSWSFDSLTSATNFPSELTWTGKLNSSHLTVKVMYYRSSTDWLVQQKLVHTVLNTEYVRSGMYSGSSATWNKWQKIEVEEEIPIFDNVKISNWTYADSGSFIDFSYDGVVLTNNDLPNKFGIHLTRNSTIHSLYNDPVYFMFSANNDAETEEPTDMYAIKIYSTTNGSNALVNAKNYDFGEQGNNYIYYFKRDTSNGNYILLNPKFVARSVSTVDSTIGYGLSRVINNVNRNKYYTGEALSAYQGYLLGQKVLPVEVVVESAVVGGTTCIFIRDLEFLDTLKDHETCKIKIMNSVSDLAAIYNNANNIKNIELYPYAKTGTPPQLIDRSYTLYRLDIKGNMSVVSLNELNSGQELELQKIFYDNETSGDNYDIYLMNSNDTNHSLDADGQVYSSFYDVDAYYDGYFSVKLTAPDYNLPAGDYACFQLRTWGQDNMERIQLAIDGRSNVLYVRYNSQGNPNGFSSWNVIGGSSSGDYLPLTGGAISGNLSMTGNLTLKGSGNYGNKINFGDGDYCHIYEPTDDHLEIKGSYINFVTPDNTSGRFTLNGVDIDSTKKQNEWIATTAGTGSAYTVTLNPVPTELKVGMKITIIPHVVSAGQYPTLDVNGLGAKQIRRRLSTYTNSNGYYSYTTSSLSANMPVNLMYDGTYWIQVDNTKVSYADIDGLSTNYVGRGAGSMSTNPAVTTAGVRNIYAGTTAMTSGTTALTTGAIYLQYE